VAHTVTQRTLVVKELGIQQEVAHRVALVAAFIRAQLAPLLVKVTMVAHRLMLAPSIAVVAVVAQVR
jgi:hypothetical protein